jgi:hypothetical protein
LILFGRTSKDAIKPSPAIAPYSASDVASCFSPHPIMKEVLDPSTGILHTLEVSIPLSIEAVD